MPSQDDYGRPNDPDIQLVPDTLRVYRHFLAFNGELWPMATMSISNNPYALQPDSTYDSYFPDVVFRGCTCAFCTSSGMGTRTPEPVPEGTRRSPSPFQATCRKKEFTLGRMFSVPVSPPVGEGHTSPDKECKCGFYAHYSPTEDFYPSVTWRYRSDRDTASAAPGTPQDPYSDKMIMVKAVVEMSGTVVMGTKGVRGQKMKIIALAPDWNKYDHYYDSNNQGIQYSGRWNGWTGTPNWYLFPSSRGASADTRYEIDKHVSKVAYSYSTEYFSDTQAMHEAYPQPNIDHLKPAEEEPPQQQVVSANLKDLAVKLLKNSQKYDTP